MVQNSEAELDPFKHVLSSPVRHSANFEPDQTGPRPTT